MRRTITKSGETPLGPIVPSRMPPSNSFPAIGIPGVTLPKQEDQLSASPPGPNETDPQLPRPPQNSRMLFRLAALLSL